MTRVIVDLTDAEMIALGYTFAAGEAKALAEDRRALAARIMAIMAKVWDSNERAMSDREKLDSILVQREAERLRARASAESGPPPSAPRSDK